MMLGFFFSQNCFAILRLRAIRFIFGTSVNVFIPKPRVPQWLCFIIYRNNIVFRVSLMTESDSVLHEVLK